MKKSTLYLKALTNVLIYIVAAVLVICLLPKLLVFFLPFVIGWIVSAIANPAVKFFEEKIKFKRKASSAVMIVLILAIIIIAGYGIIVFLVNQCVGFIRSLPENWTNWQGALNTFGSNFNTLFKNLPAELKDPLNNMGNFLTSSLGNFIKNLSSGEAGSALIANISSGIGSIANILVGIIMTVLSAYFLTVEHNNIFDKMERHIPDKAFSKFMAAYKGLKDAVGGYFKAQMQIEIWVYVVTVIGLLICRVEFAVVIALGIAILDFLPFFGAGLIMIPWAVIAFADESYFLAIGMLITWGVGQLVRQLIQPKIVGDKVGVKPLPTLVLLFLGYKFWSVFGMVVAVPIAMIFISLYQEGVFDNLFESLRILGDGLSAFITLPKREVIEKMEKEEEE